VERAPLGAEDQQNPACPSQPIGCRQLLTSVRRQLGSGHVTDHCGGGSEDNPRRHADGVAGRRAEGLRHRKLGRGGSDLGDGPFAEPEVRLHRSVRADAHVGVGRLQGIGHRAASAPA